MTNQHSKPNNEIPQETPKPSWIQTQWQQLRGFRWQDVVIAQVDEGAENVAVGKNIFQINVAGRNITPYIVVIMLATLVVVSYLVYPTVEPIWNPWPMEGDFNIAVADFGVLDMTGEGQSRMRRSDFGSQLSASIYGQMTDAYNLLKDEGGFELNVLLWHDSLGRGDGKNVQLGLIEGATPEARTASAQALAARIQADMIVYGYLTEENDPESLVLEFYYDAPAREGHPDILWGGHEFGQPISAGISYKVNPSTAKRTVVQSLIPRIRGLTWITQALAELLAGQPERALRILRDVDAALVDEWQDEDGKEIYYLMLGSAAFSVGDFDLAQTSLETAIALAPDYVPALDMLGSVYLYRAQLYIFRETGIPENQAECIAEDLVANSDDTLALAMANTETAIDYLQQALALAPDWYWPPYQYRVQLDLGIGYFARGYWGLLTGDVETVTTNLALAEQTFDEALVGFPPEEQPVFYARVQERLAAVDRIRAHVSLQQENKLETIDWLEQSIDHNQACIDLREQTAGSIYFQKRILTCSCIPAHEEAITVLADVRADVE
ncbi:MAG: hypothetical protein AAF639_07705 [Chloroflexota bacterium]